MRSLIDPVMARQNWLEAYHSTTDRGAAPLNDYARANDPFSRVGKESVSVEVTSVLRASDSSFQVRWIERRLMNGSAAGLERWTAVISLVLQPPRTEESCAATRSASTSTACPGAVSWTPRKGAKKP